MTANRLADQFGVNVQKLGWGSRNRKYVAFRGGNGTGEPVQDIAEAYTLATLGRRLERAAKVARLTRDGLESSDYEGDRDAIAAACEQLPGVDCYA